MKKLGLGYRVAKRALDVGASGVGLAITSPITVPAALGIWATMGRPILFRQQRPGLGGEPFEMCKFRTMRHAKPGEDPLQSDGTRITRLGSFLRRTSIDELPTLLNVLRGDMSLVGPRPLLMRYLTRYNEEQARRHWVKPGVTGWAQINGRNAISWEKKFQLDCWYVDHASLPLDLSILLKTVGKVVRRSDITAEGHATTTEFMGS